MGVNFQTLFKGIVVIVVSTTALVLAQLWFSPFKQIFFWKALATLVILGLLFSLLIAIKQDVAEEKKMRDDKFLN